jgi:hypothetical protein
MAVDGRPIFLTGISLFDALGPVPPRDQDLDAIQNWGMRIVRVWAHWHVPIYERDGSLSADERARLLDLTARLRSRSLLLELALLRPGQLPGQPFPAFEPEAARERAVVEIASAARGHPNVLFDLCNEHDHPDGPMTHAEARRLRDRIKAIDSTRLVTISSTGSHLIGADGHMTEEQVRNLREEAGQGPGEVGVDLIAPHLPRTADWAEATGVRVATIRAALDRIGRPLPVYLNEENRAEDDATIRPEAYALALTNARRAGAAGWLFHTGAGFDLKNRPFLTALGRNEGAALRDLAR